MFSRLTAVLAAISAVTCASAQTVHWKTNYYSVAGTTMREIRHSMARSKPFQEDFEGLTQWNVTWHFSARGGREGCRCTSFSTETTITTYLPRWKTTPEADERTREHWSRYIKALGEHEHGHAKIALAAAAKIRKIGAQATTAADCRVLSQTLNRAAERAIEEHRQQEKEFDRRTQHGTR